MLPWLTASCTTSAVRAQRTADSRPSLLDLQQHRSSTQLVVATVGAPDNICLATLLLLMAVELGISPTAARDSKVLLSMTFQ
jgi:hypothetical protein